LEIITINNDDSNNSMAPRRFLDNDEYSVAVPLYPGLEERRKSLNSVVNNSSRKNFEKFKLQVSPNETVKGFFENRHCFKVAK
jgi:hypothetical protein